MDARAARRLAYAEAADIIGSALDAGIEHWSNDYGSDDNDRLRAALWEIADECLVKSVKGWRAPQVRGRNDDGDKGRAAGE
jgi:hypothetical protein